MASNQPQLIILIKYTLVGVITLTSVALIAEMLPEVHAKPIVIASLASALTLMVVELYRLRRDTISNNHG